MKLVPVLELVENMTPAQTSGSSSDGAVDWPRNTAIGRRNQSNADWIPNHIRRYMLLEILTVWREPPFSEQTAWLACPKNTMSRRSFKAAQDAVNRLWMKPQASVQRHPSAFGAPSEHCVERSASSHRCCEQVSVGSYALHFYDRLHVSGCRVTLDKPGVSDCR